MKRKTAVCKCGRTVESTTKHCTSRGHSIVTYRIHCMNCGRDTGSWMWIAATWAEWKRLQEANDGK